MELSLGTRFKNAFRRNKDYKLGTIKGVFIPNILQMIGVILFMRLGWVLGHVGSTSMLSIISLASSILIVTSLSLSSIVSNMKVGSGGAYFIISRVLGVEFGSAIGILLCVSQHASIALCVSGFSVSLQQFFPDISILLIEAVTLTSLIVISYISTQLAVKAQLLIFFALFASIGAIFLYSAPFDAALLPAAEATTATTLTFWLAIAMFFPAATGIEAGMSMSGDLRTPSRSLPLGTLASVLVAYLIYSGLTIFLSSHVPAEFLREHPFIVYHIAKIKPLVILGVWGATLSSALGSILGAPRVIQALAKDRVLPSFLSKGHGKSNQPRIAIVLVYCAAMGLTLGTNINQIIPMMTMICLVSYGMINFVAFFEGFLKNPSWRPHFQTPWPLALIGSLGCFTAMFLINPVASLIVIGLTVAICLVTSTRGIGGGWDDIRFSLFSFLVHKGAAKLSSFSPNAKSWRPNILSLFNENAFCSNLALFSHALDHGKGFLTFGVHASAQEESIQGVRQHISDLKIPAFLHVNHSENTPGNLVQTVKNYGFGPLVPNTVLLPLSTGLNALLQVLEDASRVQKNIVILKSDEGNPRLYSEPFVTPKKINLWWRGGNQNNFELCLALSYSLRGSSIWSGIEICIKSLVKSQETKDQLSHVFERYHKKLRIKKLSFEPILDEDGDFFSNLISYSKDADFTFLGLRIRKEGESHEEYQAYFESLLEKTAPVPNLAYVLAGENLSFQKIFD